MIYFQSSDIPWLFEKSSDDKADQSALFFHHLIVHQFSSEFEFLEFFDRVVWFLIEGYFPELVHPTNIPSTNVQHKDTKTISWL